MADFGAHELEFLRIIVQEIVVNEERQLSQMSALHRAHDVKTKKISQQVVI